MLESITINLIKTENLFTVTVRDHLTRRQIEIATQQADHIRPVVARAHELQQQGAMFDAIQDALTAVIKDMIRAA